MDDFLIVGATVLFFILSLGLIVFFDSLSRNEQ